MLTINNRIKLLALTPLLVLSVVGGVFFAGHSLFAQTGIPSLPTAGGSGTGQPAGIDILKYDSSMYTTASQWETTQRSTFEKSVFSDFAKKVNAMVATNIEIQVAFSDYCGGDCSGKDLFVESVPNSSLPPLSQHPTLLAYLQTPPGTKSDLEGTLGIVVIQYLNPAFKVYAQLYGNIHSIDVLNQGIVSMIEGIHEQVQEQIDAYRMYAGMGRYYDGNTKNSEYDLLDQIHSIDTQFFRNTPDVKTVVNTSAEKLSALFIGNTQPAQTAQSGAIAPTSNISSVQSGTTAPTSNSPSALTSGSISSTSNSLSSQRTGSTVPNINPSLYASGLGVELRDKLGIPSTTKKPVDMVSGFAAPVIPTTDQINTFARNNPGAVDLRGTTLLMTQADVKAITKLSSSIPSQSTTSTPPASSFDINKMIPGGSGQGGNGLTNALTQINNTANVVSGIGALGLPGGVLTLPSTYASINALSGGVPSSPPKNTQTSSQKPTNTNEGIFEVITKALSNTMLMFPESEQGKDTFQGMVESAITTFIKYGAVRDLLCKTSPNINFLESSRDPRVDISKNLAGSGVYLFETPTPINTMTHTPDKVSPQQPGTAVQQLADNEIARTLQTQLKRSFQKYGLDYEKPSNLKSSYFQMRLRYAIEDADASESIIDTQRSIQRAILDFDRYKTSNGIGNTPSEGQTNINDSVIQLGRIFYTLDTRTSLLLNFYRQFRTILGYFKDKPDCLPGMGILPRQGGQGGQAGGGGATDGTMAGYDPNATKSDKLTDAQQAEVDKVKASFAASGQVSAEEMATLDKALRRNALNNPDFSASQPFVAHDVGLKKAYVYTPDGMGGGSVSVGPASHGYSGVNNVAGSGGTSLGSKSLSPGWSDSNLQYRTIVHGLETSNANDEARYVRIHEARGSNTAGCTGLTTPMANAVFQSVNTSRGGSQEVFDSRNFNFTK